MANVRENARPMLHGSTSCGWGSATAPLGSATTTVSASNGKRPRCVNRAVSPSIFCRSQAVVALGGPA